MSLCLLIDRKGSPMPSPFPGMDPYLEGDLWTSFNAHFTVELARQLAPQLRPNYVGLAQLTNTLDTSSPFKVPHSWVEIKDVKNRKLVTKIEFLSPTTKRGLARGQYLEKRKNILLSMSHVMEIDLLREGQRV